LTSTLAKPQCPDSKMGLAKWSKLRSQFSVTFLSLGQSFCINSDNIRHNLNNWVDYFI
jgi:hypothetical protein